MSRGVKGTAVLAVALALWGTSGIAANSADEPRHPDGSTPLQWAVFEADIPEAERLVKAGADVSATNNYGISPMLLAADIANTRLIRLLMDAGADARSANPDGETALHLVARAGNVEAAKMLLKAGAVVDAREKLGQQTPLMWAVARRQPAMVELLVGNGADINARGAIRDYQRVATAESRAKSLDRGGLTPLLYAARENCRECAQILLKHGVDVNKPDPSGVTPLVFAMLNGNWDIARSLVEAGADVNQWDMYGLSPLAVAIAGMNGGGSRNPLDDDRPDTATGPELVQMLIARGANPNQQTYFRPGTGRGGGGRGSTPFMAAVSSGNLDLVRQLLDKGADPRLAMSEGQGPIILAVQARSGGGGGGGGGRGGGGPPGGFGGGAPGGGAPAGGTAPGDAPGADDGASGPTAQVPASSSAPALAALPPAAVRAAAGAAPAGPARGGGPPGGAAGRGGGPGAGGAGGAPGGAARGGGTNTAVELIKLLADAGADPHLVARRHFLQRSRGGSAMHFAVRSGGNRQVIQALLDLGVDINGKDEDGLTALDYAMGRGYVPFLQMPQAPNTALADYLRSVGATVELDRIPDWPPQGPPIATVVYDSVIWPVDPVGP